MKKRHLIIGAGNAGLNAATAIARLKPQDEIELISDEPWAPYCRCLLTYYLEGKITEKRLFAWGEEIIRKNRLKYQCHKKVVSVDTENLQVEFADGSRHDADTILIATGGQPLRPDFLGAELPGIFTLRNFNDAQAIKQKLHPGGRWAVAGAGLVSLKTITALHRYDISIDLLVSSNRILSQVLDPHSSAMAAAKLKENRIDIHLNEDITAAEPATGNRLKLITNSGRELLVDGLLYGKGVDAVNPLANGNSPDLNSRDNWGAEQNDPPQLGAETADGITVNSRLEFKPNIFAAGDTARIFDLVRQKNDRLPLWPLAGEQGRIAGHNMATDTQKPSRNYNGGINCNSFSLFGLDFISAGYREIPHNSCDWHSEEQLQTNSYCRLNFHRNQLKGFILCAADRTNLNQLKKSGPLLARIKREARFDSACYNSLWRQTEPLQPES